jgi:hypothetical protein
MQYVGVGRYQAPQIKAVSGSSATFDNAIATGVTRAMLSATVDICFRQGKAPLTAVTTDNVVYASSPLHILISAGESVAIIARDGSATGTAYLSEVA